MDTSHAGIKIGKSAGNNWDILDQAEPHHWWFHLSCYPSCYVICEDGDRVEECARLCKENTKYKNLPNLRVIYTQCSNLRKTMTVGEVEFKSNRRVKTICI